MGDLVISANWLEGIKGALRAVTSSGQAYAAINEALAFGNDAADAVRSGGSFWSADPWRTAAASDVDGAATTLKREFPYYSSDSETPVAGTWDGTSQKILYLYSMGQIARQGYPADEDTSSIDSVLLGGAANLTGAILGAPKAVLNYATDLASTAIDSVTTVGKKVVKGAGTILTEAATNIKSAAETLIPWGTIGGAVLVLAVGVGLVVVLTKTGALKSVAALKPV